MRSTSAASALHVSRTPWCADDEGIAAGEALGRLPKNFEGGLFEQGRSRPLGLAEPYRRKPDAAIDDTGLQFISVRG